MNKITIDIEKSKKGNKHMIKEIAEIIEKNGYAIKLKINYGSGVESNINGEIEFE